MSSSQGVYLWGGGANVGSCTASEASETLLRTTSSVLGGGGCSRSQLAFSRLPDGVVEDCLPACAEGAGRGGRHSRERMS